MGVEFLIGSFLCNCSSLEVDLPKSLPRQKYKMMTSAKERHKAEETCIVASRERGHCSKAYGGGQNSAHLL